MNIFKAHAGIKRTTDDLVIIEIPEKANTVAVFTQNQFIAAPVIIAKKNINSTNRIRGLIINSGNANCGTGAAGLEVCDNSCQHLAQKLKCNTNQILPFSTGVINQTLDEKILILGIDKALSHPKSTIEDAARAIMTTDTKPKVVSETLEINGKRVTIQGIAKGSGMIQPNMATMLAFVFTDAEIPCKDLESAIKIATDCSFNCITVDGDTSTNDSCTLTATATSTVNLNKKSPYWQKWQESLKHVFIKLAQSIILDGEGATKMAHIKVIGGLNFDDCKKVAYSVANSPLVKTALFAEDPNLGRIAAAIGKSEVKINFNKITIHIDDLIVMENSCLSDQYDEGLANKIMKNDEYVITINLNQASAQATVWTTDLSYEYVKINSDYRS